MSCSSRAPLCGSQDSIGVSISSSSQPSASHHRENNRRLVNAESVARICDIVEQSASGFNAVNVATAFHRMAKLWNSPATGPSGAQMFLRADQCVRKLGELAILHLRYTPTSCSVQICVSRRYACCWEKPRLETFKHVFFVLLCRCSTQKRQ